MQAIVGVPEIAETEKIERNRETGGGRRDCSDCRACRDCRPCRDCRDCRDRGGGRDCKDSAALAVMVRLIVAATVGALVCGRWLWSRGRADSAKSRADPRHGLDTAAARRRARAEFYRAHKNFDHTCAPETDADRGLDVTETLVVNSRGVEIFVKSWVPANLRLRGAVFLCHGYGDSVTFYYEGVGRTLAMAGYAVYGMDFPGFGMSEGLHGYIPDFDALVGDAIEQYRSIRERAELDGVPSFLFGESMGGAVALLAHLREPQRWDGAVLLAPMCKIGDAMYPPWFLLHILIALAHVIPTAKLVPSQDIAAIGFRDPAKRLLAHFNPVAYSGKPRLRTAVELLRVTDCIESRMHEVTLPLLVLHGASDRVTDSAISQLLHERARSEDKTLRLYEGAWHCLLQGEPDEMVRNVVTDMISWLDARAGAKTAAPPEASLLPLLEARDAELQVRVARAVPSLINFGAFPVPPAEGSPRIP